MSHRDRNFIIKSPYGTINTALEGDYSDSVILNLFPVATLYMKMYWLRA